MNKWTFLILLSYLKLVFILINELTHELLTEKQCFPTWSSLSVTEICMWNIDMYAKYRPISTGASANNMDRLSPIPKGNRILIYSTMVWSVASHVAVCAFLLCKSARVKITFSVQGPEHSRQLYSILSIYFQTMVGSGSSQKNLCVPSLRSLFTGDWGVDSLRARMCCMSPPSLEAYLC